MDELGYADGEKGALTAQNPAVRRGSFHDRMRAICFAKAATPTTWEASCGLKREELEVRGAYYGNVHALEIRA